MRGLPSCGKSTKVAEILRTQNVPYDGHVFATDDYFIPTTKRLRNPVPEDADAAMQLALAIYSAWFRVRWSKVKERHKQEFLMFKKMVDAGNYKTAVTYAKENAHIFQSVEYQGTWDGAAVHYVYKRNLEAILETMEYGVTPIILDSVNSRLEDCAEIIKYGHNLGYEIDVQEPDHPIWKTHRNMFGDRYKYGEALEAFARTLAENNIHGVPYENIVRMMNRWKDTGVNEIIKK